MREVKGLTFKQNKDLQRAIFKGYLEGYEDDPRKWRHSFVGTFLTKYPKRVKTLDVLTDIVGHTPEWQDFDDVLVSDFMHEYGQTHSANTNKVIFAELRSVLNSCVTGEMKQLMFPRALYRREEPSQAVYLDEIETEIIRTDFIPKSDIDRYVKKIFMIESFTGARSSDSRRLTPDNCDFRTDTLSYVSQKTKQLVSLPVHEHLMEFLSDPISLPNMYVATFEDGIRRMCRVCGIDQRTTLYRRGEQQSGPKYKFVTSHTARRSFATNLYLRGVDPAVIAQFMGHTTQETTIRRYIIGRRRVKDTDIRFFKAPGQEIQTIVNP